MSDLSFDTSINTNLHQNVQDGLSLSVADITGGAIATTTDFAASIWNGLPGTTNVETGDLLKNINSDALRVYEQAPDLIHAASLIGGSFVPVGLAAKGMTAMRAGVKGMDWFSVAGKTASIAEAASQFAASGSETVAYRSLMKSIYTKSAINQAIDAVAMEAALATTFHAHPLMEDYMQDPVKNFAISAAFGGVLGGAIGIFGDRALVREAVGPLAEGVLNNTVGKMIPTLPSATNATNLAIHDLNIKNLNNIMASLEKEGKNEVNDFTFATADALKKRTIVQQNELFEAMISPELRNLPATEKKDLLEKLSTSNEMMGVENIRLLTAKDLEVEGLVKPPSSLLSGQPILDNLSKGPVATVTSKQAVYFPELNLYGVKDDVKHYASAAALGKSEAQIEANWVKTSKDGRVPNYDTGLELLSQGSAEVQGNYIGAMVRVSKMSAKELENLHVYEGDGPLLNAILYKMNTDPEVAGSLIKISPKNEVPAIRYQQIETAINKTVPQVEAGSTRLWKTGDGLFTNDLKGNVLPSKELAKGGLSYVDVPDAVIAGVTKNGKIELSNEYAAKAVPVDVPKLPVTPTVASINDIKNLMLREKQASIDSLIANGIPSDSIALKTNTPVSAVESYMANKSAFDAVDNPVSLNTIKSLDDISEILSPKNQPYVLTGNIRKPQYVQNISGLNNRTLANIDQEYKRVMMMQSKSSVATEMASFLDDYSNYIGILKSQIGNVNPQVSGNRFFNSFDHWSKDMKQAGMISSVFGKEFQNIGNRALNKILEPVKALMTSVAKDEAAAIEFNHAMSINNSLKGWRMFSEDGKLYQRVIKVGEDGKKVTILEAVKLSDGTDFQLATDSVKALVKGIQEQSPELRNLANTIKKIQGSPDVNDIGFWAPSFNPVNKFIAYVHNEAEDTVKMLWAKTPAEFESTVLNYKKYLLESGTKGVQIYKKGEQDFWNVLNDRLDTVNMQRADIGLQKAGKTGGAIVSSDLNIFGEIVGGYEHYVSSQVRNLADLALSDITDSLRKMSILNNLNTEAQPLDKIKTVLTKSPDAAKTFHNALLGNSNLGEYSGWQSLNRSFETYLNVASNFMGATLKTAIAPLSLFKKDGSIATEKLKNINYDKINATLKERGIQNPYAPFEDAAASMFAASKLADSQDQAKRFIYASNALIATAALRFGEIAQPLVNMLSMPVLTSLAIGDKMPSTFLGVQKGTLRVAPMEVMHEGIRAMNSPVFAALNKKWEDAGYFKPLVSEVSDLMRASRQFDKGIMTKIENGLDTKFVQTVSKPADYAEALTRKAAMNIGAQVGKRLYPELDDNGITIFARDFMDKALGNFNASQRPVFFQGTLGAALGLFQTYSLTLGQSIYRHLELKNYKELGKAALLQSALFGTKSLPGFDLVSNAIGEHYSDEHFDLETGTYRSIKDPMARWILYGLPSNLGPSISSRGDADPRLPVINDMVAYNFAKQTGAMFGEIKRSLDSDAPQMGRALAQALSLQSMSRPLARTAELATGYSITKAGNTVQIPEEVWTPTGIISRVMATRPIEEQQLRDMDHLNRFYGSADRKNRQDVTESLKTAIRDGSLDDGFLSKLGDKYMRANGSPTGWRSSVNTALAKTETSGKETFIQKLKPNSPFMFMMDGLDGE